MNWLKNMFKAKPVVPANSIYIDSTGTVKITGPIVEQIADAELIKIAGESFVNVRIMTDKLNAWKEADKERSKPCTPPQDPRDPGPGSHLFGPRNEDC